MLPINHDGNFDICTQFGIHAMQCNDPNFVLIIALL